MEGSRREGAGGPTTLLTSRTRGLRDKPYFVPQLRDYEGRPKRAGRPRRAGGGEIRPAVAGLRRAP